MQLITDIKDIKLYYPFLRDRKTRAKEHYKDVLSYLLLCDKVIISPSHFFNENVVRKNADFLKNTDLFAQLFKNGLIVTTSTNKNIRDYHDLIEQRSGFSDVKIPNFSLPLFYRDGNKQKEEYLKFFKKEFKTFKDYFNESDSYKEIITFLKSKPDHSELIPKLHKLRKTEEKPLVDTSKYLAQITYLKGGADGNNAIMPTIYSSDEHTFFNDYYSLKFARQFAYRLSKKIGKDITELKFEEFLTISSSLKAFKDDYFLRSDFMKTLDNEVYSVLVNMNQKDKYRKYKRQINFISGLVVGELIEDFILPLVNIQSPGDFTLKIAVAFFFERFNMFDKLFAVANKTVDTLTFKNYLNEYFGELVNKFDNGIKLTM